MALLHLGDRRVVLARTEEGLVAFDDRCTHRGGPLSDGTLACGTVQCPWHGSQFDVRTGRAVHGPAEASIAVHRVTERDGRVFLQLAD
jgi:nitrite reductase/ring-hydroxylating ferredoxin subunit